MENSTINKLRTEDEIHTVESNESFIDDDECQLLLNISIDKIDLNDGVSETESFTSHSSNYQLTTMEKFNYVATRILYSKYFQYYYFFIVILSGISLIISYLSECTNIFHYALESLIIIALIIEVTIRLLAKKKYFFYSFWNILDVIIISVCVWLFFLTENQCPMNDRIIDNGILVARYIIQFIRLGILLKKNKSSHTNRKRKSVNFNQLRNRPNYGSINQSSYSTLRKETRRNVKNENDKEDDDDEDVGNNTYPTISKAINTNIYNPYGNRYDDSRIENIYENIPNESLINSSYLSHSLIAYLQEGNGSIDININSNANFAKMFYDDDNSTVDFEGSKRPLGTSLHSTNNDIYQKLIHSNIENNNRNGHGVFSNAAGLAAGEYRIPININRERGLSNESLSTNPIETPTPTSSFMSPSPGSILRRQFPPQLAPLALQPQQQPQPQNQSQFQPQSLSQTPKISTSIQTDSSFIQYLPPKSGRKQNLIVPTNHSSTFSEVPSRVNLLSPILYGSPSNK